MFRRTASKSNTGTRANRRQSDQNKIMIFGRKLRFPMRFDHSFSTNANYKQSLVSIDGLMQRESSVASLWPELGWRTGLVVEGQNYEVRQQTRKSSIWSRIGGPERRFFVEIVCCRTMSSLDVTRRADVSKNGSKSNIGTRENQRPPDQHKMVMLGSKIEMFDEIRQFVFHERQLQTITGVHR